MSKTIAPFTSPVIGDTPDIALIKANDDALRAFANDHDASHWPFTLSAPISTDFSFSGTTGGSMTAAQTKRFKLSFFTPNGETKASAEMTCAIDGGQNAFTFTIAAVDPGFTTRLGIYVAEAGASQGATCYKTRTADVSVSGTGASVNADGEVVLSTSGTTTITVVAHPPDTQAAAPSSNASGSQDPLTMIGAFQPQTQTISADGATYTVTVGTFTYIWVYASGTLSTLRVKAQNVSIARYAATYDTSGNFSGLTQTEA